MPASLPPLTLAAPPFASRASPLPILPTFSKQALRFNSRKALIPKREGDRNMLLQAFSKSLHTLSLPVNLPITGHYRRLP